METGKEKKKEDETEQLRKQARIIIEGNERRVSKIRNLIRKHKKFIGSYNTILPFKQPVAWLIRRSRAVEFFEGVKGDFFKFQHSNGEEREIELSQGMLLTFPMGDSYFTGFILHEDNKYPLPQDPLLHIEMMRIAQEKLMNDIATWKAKELRAKAGIIQAIVGGVGVIAILYILYRLVIPAPAAEEVAKETTKQVIQNVTILMGL